MASMDEQQLRQIFKLCDKDGNGQIDKNELEYMLSELQINIDAQELLNKMDTDGNGTISFDEFYYGFGALLESQQKETKLQPTTEDLEEVKKIFAVLSTESEHLRPEEILPVYPLLKDYYSTELEFERKAMELDTNKEGNITWEQFIPIGRQLVDSGKKANDVKKQVFGENALEFTTEQMLKLRGIFHFMDEDSSGRIDEFEFQGAMKQMGKEITIDESKKMVLELDTNGDGGIDFSEFVRGIGPFFLNSVEPTVISSSVPELTEEHIQEVKRIFAVIDANGDGMLTIGELGSVLKDLGKKISKSELDYLFHQIDVNGDGKITLDEFINGMARLQALSLFIVEEKEEKEEEKEQIDYKTISQGLQMRLKSLEKLLKKIEKERAILQQELDSMRKETIANRKKLKELETLREQISDLTTTNAELVDKTEKFDKEIKHTKIHAKKLEEERNQLENSIQLKEVEIERLTSQCATLEATAKTTKAKAETVQLDLQSKVREYSKENEELKKVLIAKTKESEYLQEDRKQLDVNLRNSREFVIDLKTQLENAQLGKKPSFYSTGESLGDIELQKEKDDHQKTKKRVSELIEEADSLRVQLDSLRKAYDNYVQEQEMKQRKSSNEELPLLETKAPRKRDEECCCVIV